VGSGQWAVGLGIDCIKVRYSGGSCKAILDLWATENRNRLDGCVASQSRSSSACLTDNYEVWMSPNRLAQQYTLPLVHRPTTWLVPPLSVQPLCTVLDGGHGVKTARLGTVYSSCAKHWQACSLVLTVAICTGEPANL
jgi:hypothetical protein